MGLSICVFFNHELKLELHKVVSTGNVGKMQCSSELYAWVSKDIVIHNNILQERIKATEEEIKDLID